MVVQNNGGSEQWWFRTMVVQNPLMSIFGYKAFNRPIANFRHSTIMSPSTASTSQRGSRYRTPSACSAINKKKTILPTYRKPPIASPSVMALLREQMRVCHDVAFTVDADNRYIISPKETQMCERIGAMMEMLRVEFGNKDFKINRRNMYAHMINRLFYCHADQDNEECVIAMTMRATAGNIMRTIDPKNKDQDAYMELYCSESPIDEMPLTVKVESTKNAFAVRFMDTMRRHGYMPYRCGNISVI
jgi:hypothetical protein